MDEDSATLDALRAAGYAIPSIEGMVPYPYSAPAGFDIPPTAEAYIRSQMGQYGVEPTIRGDLVDVFRGESPYSGSAEPPFYGTNRRYWGLDPETANYFAQHEGSTVTKGVLPVEDAARALNVRPSAGTLFAQELAKESPDLQTIRYLAPFAETGVPTMNEIRVDPESSELIKSGRGASATAQAIDRNIRELATGVPGTGTPAVKPNPLLQGGRIALKSLGRVIPGLNVAGGALAAYEHEQKGQDVRKWLAAASTAPYGLGIPPFIGEQAVNLGEWMGSPLEEVSPYPKTPAYIGNPETWASEAPAVTLDDSPALREALYDVAWENIIPWKKGPTDPLMDQLRSNLTASMTPQQREDYRKYVSDNPADLTPEIPGEHIDALVNLYSGGGNLQNVAGVIPAPTAAKFLNKVESILGKEGYAEGVKDSTNLEQGALWQGELDPWNMLYGRKIFEGQYGSPYSEERFKGTELFPDPVLMKKDVPPAGVDTRMPELDDSRQLASLGDPEAAFRVPLGAATPVSQALQGIFPEGAPTSLMEEAQPPRTLPIGTQGWEPTLGGTLAPYNIHGDVDVLDTTSQLSELARGIGTDDPNVMSQSAQSLLASFEETPEIADIVNKQISQAFRGSDAANFWRAINPISSAQAAIDRDAEFEREKREPTWFPPTTSSGIGGMVEEPSLSVPTGFEALAELIKSDPDVAKKYTGAPGEATAELANLVANTGVETFADVPEIPWTPPAPVVPDITQEIADFSAIRDADEERRNREQDKLERELEHAANVRRKDEEKARLASARNAKAEQARINKENKERKAEEKRIADKQAADEKQRRLIDKQMADMLKSMEETRQAYLDRKKKEEDRRRRQGYGVGAMYT